MDFSSSGECLAFGGSGGFVHLWGFNHEPRVNLRSTRVEVPPLIPPPSLALDEDDSFAAFNLSYHPQVNLAHHAFPSAAKFCNQI